MPKNKGKSNVTLEALLQLKRHERPDADFWDTFEHDFHRRRLHALVERRTLRDWLWHPAMRTVAISVPALMLAGLSIFWSRQVVPSPAYEARAESRTANPPAEWPATALVAAVEASGEEPPVTRRGMAASQFVMDAFETEPSASANFRKVMYTPAIRLSAPNGSFYVRDSMSAGSYQVTTADFRPGRNF